GASAPLRVEARPRRHPADDTHRAGRPDVAVLDDARVRPRRVRVRRRRAAGTEPAWPRYLERDPRVAEPDVGEPRGTQPRLLAVVLSTAAAALSRGAWRSRRGRVRPRRQRHPTRSDSGRRGRGDLWSAHHPALRARAGAARGDGRGP